MSKDAPGIAEKCRRFLSNHSFSCNSFHKHWQVRDATVLIRAELCQGKIKVNKIVTLDFEMVDSHSEEDECVLIEMKRMSSQAPVVLGQLHGLLEFFLNIHTYGLYCNHYKHVDLLFKGSGKGKFIIMLVITTWAKTSFRS